MKVFSSSQFAYCALTGMFHRRKINHKIKRLNENFFRIVYHDTTSSFGELLKKDNFILIHYKCIQVLTTKLLRVYKWIFPKIMMEVFPLSQYLHYNTRHDTNLISQQDQLKVLMKVPIRQVMLDLKFGSQFLFNLKMENI